MKKLEVGQYFEVVEVLNSHYDSGVFKIGGLTRAEKMFNGRGYNCLINGIYSDNIKTRVLFKEYVKPVGRLIIKSVK